MDIQLIVMYLLSASALKGYKVLLLDSIVMATVLPRTLEGSEILVALDAGGVVVDHSLRRVSHPPPPTSAPLLPLAIGLTH